MPSPAAGVERASRFKMSTKITSWNVNSIKARGPHVERFLKERDIDVLMVQELKGIDFPAEQFKAFGYHTYAVTQKAYNGVAVFSKTPITVIAEALPGNDTDEQARFIDFETTSANGEKLRLINIYMPNGNPTDNDDGTMHEKYAYKLKWMARLHDYLANLRAQNIPFAIGGDFNVIPEDKDCHDPNAWRGDALFRAETHAAYRGFINLGLYDAFRIYNNTAEQYTFWDYQAGAWQKDNGIRIDHFLLPPELTDQMISCNIDKDPRGWDRPSDHTPITLTLNL